MNDRQIPFSMLETEIGKYAKDLLPCQKYMCSRSSYTTDHEWNRHIATLNCPLCHSLEWKVPLNAVSVPQGRSLFNEPYQEAKSIIKCITRFCAERCGNLPDYVKEKQKAGE